MGMTNSQVGWAVALCAKGIIGAMIACTNVVLSGGKDLDSMASALDYLDRVSKLEDKMEEARQREKAAERRNDER